MCFLNFYTLVFWTPLVGTSPNKKFPLKIFGTDHADMRTKCRFRCFQCQPGKILGRPAAHSILLVPTFHIPHLKHYTPKFLGVPQKWIWCQRFDLQLLPKSGIVPTKKGHFEVFFFHKNKKSIFAKRILTSDDVIYEQLLSPKIEFLKL